MNGINEKERERKKEKERVGRQVGLVSIGSELFP